MAGEAEAERGHLTDILFGVPEEFRFEKRMIEGF